ncbi:hypothetical protein DDB_G0280667 [Dictyostelium discoideum AX4]|uniref:Uncharacterized protein n=1 Tax=Dictyostelium discoideum TaxID=44689 RepID=Q54V19_DICDI|nr:hypothetical protein DDB_G0280667 [Dictyostelium discoideum AX4]EAL67135.1 hypothetical protein DDB_G0280667 [Dictyostelium discoideum AX4]|eukprot:XP_641112.1 hypothetical protein DDB_G0280667 [Dictyostelium discoideum AX4]
MELKIERQLIRICIASENNASDEEDNLRIKHLYYIAKQESYLQTSAIYRSILNIWPEDGSPPSKDITPQITLCGGYFQK